MKQEIEPSPIKLNDDELPWVTQILHLGSILQSNNSSTFDIIEKRRKFIGIVNSILQEFHYASPEVLMKFTEVYALSLYGSQNWDIFSNESNKLCTAWNKLVRQIFKLDWKTHRFLIEPLSDRPHIQTILICRLMKFIEKIEGHSKFGLRFLMSVNKQDQRTVVGKNFSKISQQYNSDLEIKQDIDSSKVKSWKYWTQTEKQFFESLVASELMNVKRNKFEIPGFSLNEVEELFNMICTT